MNALISVYSKIGGILMGWNYSFRRTDHIIDFPANSTGENYRQDEYKRQFQLAIKKGSRAIVIPQRYVILDFQETDNQSGGVSNLYVSSALIGDNNAIQRALSTIKDSIKSWRSPREANEYSLVIYLGNNPLK